ncbi:hypothetical protein N7495_003273 [Penicillium taxi]|uniref:uncharacterized protein n=1 Tax=Penicillium taxi TaxID=168475 RepID=UPI0025450452|nr:uncharacterized protein N7495_003273 [Penicillium taxi]KAJ5902745.1 hypothetical protein N7495_003273 [Penicillium taxi]
MAPSKVTTMSASSPPLSRKRKSRTDSPSIPNDTAGVPTSPKTVANGINGNGVSELKHVPKEIITNKTIIAKLPDFEKPVIRTFNCVKHVRASQYPEVLGALPFPNDLRGLVAWTDAFVERLGWKALQEQEKTASQELRLRRAEKEKEELNARIVGLQTKLFVAVDERHKLKAEVGHLTTRNTFLESQRKRDQDQIASMTVTVAEKQTEIWNLTQDNEKLKASIRSLEEKVQQLIAEHTGDEKEKQAIIDAFETWKAVDKKHDDEVDALVDNLKKEVTAHSDAKSKADAALAESLARRADLEAENTKLSTLRTQLEALVNSIRDQLQKLEAEFGVSQGTNATLEALLRELTKKEESAQIEIQDLHGKLHDAKISVEEAKKQVHAEIEHANLHWNVLDTIRADGGWLQTGEKHACDCPPLAFTPPVSQVGPIPTQNLAI